MSETMTTTAAAVKSKPPGRNGGGNDEDAYWARIDSFAKENAMSSAALGKGGQGRGRGWERGWGGGMTRTWPNGGSRTNCLDWWGTRCRRCRHHRCRRGGGMDDTNNEGGKWRDGVHRMMRECMQSEVEARGQGSCSCLGLRRMFLCCTSSPCNSGNAAAVRLLQGRMEMHRETQTQGGQTHLYFLQLKVLSRLHGIA